MAAANEFGTDAVLSEVGDIFALKEEERRALEAFFVDDTASLYSPVALARVELNAAVQLAQSS